MKRVLVFGCAGSGKSTFSRQLADLLGVPAICLDQYYWQPDWVETDTHIWQRTVAELAAKSAWVMDGNYSNGLSARLGRADTAVFLDMPRYLCLYRAGLRTIRHYGQVRDSMAPGCPERFSAEFYHYIWHFNKTRRPRLIDILEHFDGNSFRLTSPAEVKAYLRDVRTRRCS